MALRNLGEMNEMKAICYTNTKSTLPNWDEPLHLTQQLGYAYELDDYFVHFYGSNHGLYIISPGLTVTEGKKDGITLEEWVQATFGATNVQTMKNSPGVSCKGSWRPGLLARGELEEALEFDDYERTDEEQALMILIRGLMDVFNYVEPDNSNFNVYSHKIRELLILACTEFENQCVRILKKIGKKPIMSNYTTKDYIWLNEYCHLKEYSVRFGIYKNLRIFKPFDMWTYSHPTQSLKWYNAYNYTKHDRSGAFKEATFENLIDAISSNIVMYSVRFGPMYLYQNSPSLFSSLINQYVNLKFSNPDITTFYLPKLKIESKKIRNELIYFNSMRAKLYERWNVL